MNAEALRCDEFAGPAEIASARSTIHRWGVQRLDDEFEPAIVAACVVLAGAQLCQMIDSLTGAQRSRMARVCAETPSQPVRSIGFEGVESAAVTAFEANQFLLRIDELYRASLLRYGLIHMAMVAGLIDAPGLISFLDLYEQADVTSHALDGSFLRRRLEEHGLLLDSALTFYGLVSCFLRVEIECHSFAVCAPAPPVQSSWWRRCPMPWRQ